MARRELIGRAQERGERHGGNLQHRTDGHHAGLCHLQPRECCYPGQRVVARALIVILALPGIAVAESPVKDDESVVLFDAAARSDGDGWLVPVRGWIFEPEHGSVWRGGALAVAFEGMDFEDQGPRTARFEAVARWFLVDNERGKQLPITIAGTRVVLPKSGKDGHASKWVRLGAQDGEWVSMECRARDGRRFTGRVQLVPQTGVTVISVDDTIKVTDVLGGKRRILERTFLEPFEPVKGMAARYRAWRDAGAVFHYVSASPWHLYPELSRFIDASKFPAGTLHLREFRVKDQRRWNLLESSRPHKLREINTLMTRYPKRRFVLVGDSGEHDPEIYGQVARARPGQVTTIAIRRLPGDRWDEARHRAAFAGVKAQVIVFSRPDELPAAP
jgi:hypothetical protein